MLNTGDSIINRTKAFYALSAASVCSLADDTEKVQRKNYTRGWLKSSSMSWHKFNHRQRDQHRSDYH